MVIPRLLRVTRRTSGRIPAFCLSAGSGSAGRRRGLSYFCVEADG